VFPGQGITASFWTRDHFGSSAPIDEAHACVVLRSAFSGLAGGDAKHPTSRGASS
jgi:hypothetical protein